MVLTTMTSSEILAQGRLGEAGLCAKHTHHIQSSSEICLFHMQEHVVVVIHCRPLPFQHTFPKV